MPAALSSAAAPPARFARARVLRAFVFRVADGETRATFFLGGDILRGDSRSFSPRVYNCVMAKVDGLTTDPVILELLQRSLMPNWTGSQFQLILKNRNVSRAKLANILGRSLIPVAGAYWRAQDESTKNYFNARASFQLCSGYNVGVMQICGSYNFGDFDIIPPTQTQAGKTGWMESPVFSKTFEIRQGHPRTYFVPVKVPGTRSRYMPQLVSEPAESQILVRFNYAMGGITSSMFLEPNDVQFGPGGAMVVIVRFYRTTFRGSQFAQFSDVLPFVDGNAQYARTFFKPAGYVGGYDLIFRMVDMVGVFAFDTVVLENGSYNYARDWRCKNVSRRFTGHLQECMKNWEIFTNSAGGTLRSRFYALAD